MFNRKKTYIYGTNPDRLVRLTKDEANAVNKIRIKAVYPDLEDWDPNQRFTVNLTTKERKHYDRAASILNKDIDKNGLVDFDVPLDDTDTPVLRLKK